MATGSAPVKRINLALQGGGAHGAFTWGALTRILEDESLEIASISGTSAGALNGAAVKAGLSCPIAENPRQEAIKRLDWLWGQIGAVSDLRLSAWIDVLGPYVGIAREFYEASPAYLAMDAASQFMSPYMYGAAYVNPLERIVEQFDFANVCSDDGPEFFVCATRIRDGKIRVFSRDDITTRSILASACLPTVFQAVELFDKKTGRNEHFYDGGYSGNPALFPMFKAHLPEDIVIININPLERDELPKTPQEIDNRVNEISFNSSLLRELRAISFVKRLIAEDRLPEGAMRDLKIHMIADDEIMTSLSVMTKVHPTPYALRKLHRAGYVAAETFLGAHRDDLNECSTVNMEDMLG